MTRAGFGLSVRRFNSEKSKVARGMTAVVVGSGALLGLFFVTSKLDSAREPRRSPNLRDSISCVGLKAPTRNRFFDGPRELALTHSAYLDLAYGTCLRNMKANGRISCNGCTNELSGILRQRQRNWHNERVFEACFRCKTADRYQEIIAVRYTLAKRSAGQCQKDD